MIVAFQKKIDLSPRRSTSEASTEREQGRRRVVPRAAARAIFSFLDSFQSIWRVQI
jgi:hypothetical protein